MYYQIFVLLFYISLANCSITPTHLLITRAGPCYDAPTTAISVSELSLSSQTYRSLLSGEFNVTEEINNGWTLKATKQKCVDIRNIESCDLFSSYYLVRNGCSDDDEDKNEEETYDLLFQHAHPKLECPIKAGHYKLINYPILTKDNYGDVPEAKISTSVFGYTFRLEGYADNRRKLFCAEALLQLMYKRKHKWAEKRHDRQTTSSTQRSTTVSDEED